MTHITPTGIQGLSWMAKRPGVKEITESPVLVKAIVDKDDKRFIVVIHELSYEHQFFYVYPVKQTKSLPARKRWPAVTHGKSINGPKGKMTIEEYAESLGQLVKVSYPRKKKEALLKIDKLANPRNYIDRSNLNKDDFKLVNQKFQHKLKGKVFNY